MVVLLGDTLMEMVSPLDMMVTRFSQTGVSQVAIEPVAPQVATRYGVCGGELEPNGSLRIKRMIEKPALDEIPQVFDSRGNKLEQVYAFAARYVLSTEVMDALTSIAPGRNGEIQLTDAMAIVTQTHGFEGVVLTGQRRDIGLLENL